MSLLHNLIELDKEWLLAINGSNTPLKDNFFFLVTQTITWIPLYLTLIYIIVRSQKKGSWVTLLGIIILIVLCDQVSSSIFKEVFLRFRPSHDPSIMNLVHLVGGKRGGMYGFVSSHAANTFGLAIFTSLLFKNRGFTFSIFLWAVLNSYSRIYLGLHFPGDIIGGMLLGLIFGVLVYILYLRVYPRFVYMPHNTKMALRKEMASEFKEYFPGILSFTIILSLIVLLISAKIFLSLF